MTIRIAMKRYVELLVRRNMLIAITAESRGILHTRFGRLAEGSAQNRRVLSSKVRDPYRR